MPSGIVFLFLIQSSSQLKRSGMPACADRPARAGGEGSTLIDLAPLNKFVVLDYSMRPFII